jgi:phosphoserine aminotransferase
VPLNLLGDEAGSSNYLTTGTWSEAAIKEAKKFCTSVTECASNSANKYTDIAEPDQWEISKEAKYFHYCDNETIQGFEFKEFPYDKVPEGQLMVCDMSSNFCSKPVDWEKYDVVYAGAQKNVGPAGICITIVRSKLVANKPRKDCPLVMDWMTYGKAPQTFQNTPCCFAIYMAGLNIEYMLELGGIPAMQE